ncbi:MAG TPA: stalk domain-containing protein [Syntrophomonadaceae bacterium]|nr:stalk domain-containing protein [Syntrophomonadaceae bacterium]
MKPKIFTAFLVGILICTAVSLPLSVNANDYIRVNVNGKEIISKDAPAQIVNDRTMLPVRAISEALGMDVYWDEVNRTVDLNSPVIVTPSPQPILKPDISYMYNIPILGESVATSEQLKKILKENNPMAPDVVDLYLNIGKEYGVRGDLAFCQAAKETGWWRFGNLVKLEQHNYCGLGATGTPATGEENLLGLNPNRVYYIEGKHGAYFKTPADGVEAQIQHLYAYATNKPLPAGKELIDPRFTRVTRGIAPNWTDLNGRWAVPGTTYGHSIIADYYGKAVGIDYPAYSKVVSTSENELENLKRENANLKLEIEQLKRQI